MDRWPIDFGIWDSTKVWIFRPKTGEHRTAVITVNKVQVESYQRLFAGKWIQAKGL